MKHVTGYRPSQNRRLFGNKRPVVLQARQTGDSPGEGPPKPPSTLFPGSNVRILSTAPQWAFGPNAPPVYPGPTERPGLLGGRSFSSDITTAPPSGVLTPEVIPAPDPSRASCAPNLKETKEIVAPDRGQQAALEPIQPTQPQPDDTIKEMTEIPSHTAHDEPVEDEPGQSRASSAPDQSGPEPIYLEDFDPHTQRVIYSVMANAPELGLGPKALFATRSIEPDNPGIGEPPSDEPARRRPAKPININRHESQCTICNHPERAAIDEAFLHWWHATDLAYHFKLGHRLAVYRHAKATGLYQQRIERTQHALGYMIEQAQTVTPTGDCIIRAIRALSCLDENGRWHEPRKEVLIMHQYLDSPALPPKS
jgi:hypothetical protein